MGSKYENLLGSGSENIVQSVYDNFLKSNADFRNKAGFKMTVIRESIGVCCAWCQDLAGTYDYDSRPSDIYARHQNCNCIVVTKTERGTYQDAWSRKEYNSYREARIQRANEIAEEIEKDKKTTEDRKRLAEQIRQTLSEEKSLNKSWLNKSRQYKSLEELKLHSSSDILSKESYEDIVNYFKNEHKILISGFENKSLDDIKITLAGYDDLIREFPEAANRIKTIEYNSHLKDYGKMSRDGHSLVGPLGIGDYGTGLHEAAHALDFELSDIGTNSFSEKIVSDARKDLKLKENSKKYSDLVTKTTGLIHERKSEEIFAFSLETEMGGLSNELTKEIFSLTKKR